MKKQTMKIGEERDRNEDNRMKKGEERERN